MSETCKKCKIGRLSFYDGAMIHDARNVCSNCNAYFEDEKFMGYLEE